MNCEVEWHLLNGYYGGAIEKRFVVKHATRALDLCVFCCDGDCVTDGKIFEFELHSVQLRTAR